MPVQGSFYGFTDKLDNRTPRWGTAPVERREQTFSR